ncbi:hypothetical protein PtA15_15A362 [Puccinia triticina]|uniref:Uncharacterized protein n=1 Tax=Puccinia triticina TaxID=208348 RepID=A0ABY7D2X5_9BASI|nr:uncharacterized protein PtA15_15A362 [Puccinia triticina]WAQ91969.1 hypothetical protein PtA15_15A362 [Puccinia triticina]
MNARNSTHSSRVLAPSSYPRWSSATTLQIAPSMVADDQRDPFEGKVASLKVLNQQQKILHPRDISLPASATGVDAVPGLKTRLSSIAGARYL